MANLTHTSAPSEWMQGYLASEEVARDVISVKRLYIDLCDGNLYDGHVLTQILFWHGRNKETGKPRLKIFRDGHYWLAKTYEDWWEECRVKERVARDCIARLESRGLIVTKVYKFKGAPTKHIRMDWNAFECAIRHLMSDGNDSRCQIDLTLNGRSYTETTDIDHPSKIKGIQRRGRQAVSPPGDENPIFQGEASQEGVNVSPPGSSFPDLQKEKSSAKKEKGSAPIPKWTPDSELPRDRGGWVMLPKTTVMPWEERSEFSAIKARAVRETQLWLAECLDRIELEEDEDGQVWVEHINDLESIEEAFRAKGELPLKKMRNIAIAQGATTKSEFNSVLEECFWDEWKRVYGE